MNQMNVVLTEFPKFSELCPLDT